jgi:hypothetical protein
MSTLESVKLTLDGLPVTIKKGERKKLSAAVALPAGIRGNNGGKVFLELPEGVIKTGNIEYPDQSYGTIELNSHFTGHPSAAFQSPPKWATADHDPRLLASYKTDGSGSIQNEDDASIDIALTWKVEIQLSDSARDGLYAVSLWFMDDTTSLPARKKNITITGQSQVLVPDFTLGAYQLTNSAAPVMKGMFKTSNHPDPSDFYYKIPGGKWTKVKLEINGNNFIVPFPPGSPFKDGQEILVSLKVGDGQERAATVSVDDTKPVFERAELKSVGQDLAVNVKGTMPAGKLSTNPVEAASFTLPGSSKPMPLSPLNGSPGEFTGKRPASSVHGVLRVPTTLVTRAGVSVSKNAQFRNAKGVIDVSFALDGHHCAQSGEDVATGSGLTAGSHAIVITFKPGVPFHLPGYYVDVFLGKKNQTDLSLQKKTAPVLSSGAPQELDTTPLTHWNGHGSYRLLTVRMPAPASLNASPASYSVTLSLNVSSVIKTGHTLEVHIFATDDADRIFSQPYVCTLMLTPSQ